MLLFLQFECQLVITLLAFYTYIEGVFGVRVFILIYICSFSRMLNFVILKVYAVKYYSYFEITLCICGATQTK